MASTDGQSWFWLSGSTFSGSDIFTVTPTSRGSSKGGVVFTTGQPGVASVSLYNAFPVQALTAYSGGLYVAVSTAPVRRPLHWQR